MFQFDKARYRKFCEHFARDEGLDFWYVIGELDKDVHINAPSEYCLTASDLISESPLLRDQLEHSKNCEACRVIKAIAFYAYANEEEHLGILKYVAVKSGLPWEYYEAKIAAAGPLTSTPNCFKFAEFLKFRLLPPARTAHRAACKYCDIFSDIVLLTDIEVS